MASKTPNLDATRSAWSRFQNLWSFTIPSWFGVQGGYRQLMRELRKR